MNARELEEFIDSSFPDGGERHFDVESIGEGRVAIRVKVQPWMLRPGNTISGPTLMGLADTAAFLLVLAELGPVGAAVTSNLNIHFLRRPPADQPLWAEGELLKLGRRLALTEIRMRSGDDPEAVAYATVTYAIPRAGDGLPAGTGDEGAGD